MKRSSYPFLPWLWLGLGLLLLYWLLLQLGAVLAPFLAAAILAYMLNPAVKRLMGWGLSRSLASALMTVFTILLIIALLLMIVPMLIHQVQVLLEKLPVAVDALQNRLLPWLKASFDIQLELDAASLRKVVASNASALKATFSTLLVQLSQRGFVLMGFLFNVLLVPLLLFYFLRDWEQFGLRLTRLVPRRWRRPMSEITLELDRVLGEFMRGQLSVMLIMATLFSCSLALLGLDSGFAIGVVSGLLVFIPYLGTFLGFALAGLAAVLQYDSFFNIALVLGVFTIGQLLESFLITPFMVGERIGLSPMAVLFALLGFGQLMGFVGVLLALPMAAICLVLYRFLITPYFSSQFYRC